MRNTVQLCLPFLSSETEVEQATSRVERGNVQLSKVIDDMTIIAKMFIANRYS